MGVLELFLFSFLSFSQMPEGYLIDQVKDVYEPTCQNCPSSVGTMFAAEPLLFSEIQSADQIRYSNCHVTLTGPNTVITAAHCVRAWFVGPWEELAEQDCKRSFAFFFPSTQGFESDSVGCKSIAPVLGNYTGVNQLFPDTVEITLERNLERAYISSDSESLVFDKDQSFTLWINVSEKPKELSEVQCQWVEETAFSPASLWSKGAFTTLTCDHDVLSGTSGAGVFFNGRLVANISHGAEHHFLSASLFGYNEVVVSKLSCFNSDDQNCYMSYEESLAYLKEYHYKAFDLAYEWHPVVLENIEEHFDFATYSYQKLETDEVIQNRGFYISCLDKGANVGDELVLGFKIDQEKLNVNYVHYNEVAEIEGIYERLSSNGRPFHNSMRLITTSDFEFKEDRVEFTSQELSINEAPYCD